MLSKLIYNLTTSVGWAPEYFINSTLTSGLKQIKGTLRNVSWRVVNELMNDNNEQIVNSSSN